MMASERANLARAPSVRLLGPYTILSVLGEGGMGMVYKAEQKTPIHRFVALKVVKPGLNTREIITRFQSERRSLALMNHPNIAMVHDAGMTELGQPYFAMEYVEGLAITKFADQQKLTIRQRLELFLQVCEAISHAHKKLIIHRDIKASNVLAYLQDGKPAVKVIDFGIAKALSGEGAEDSTMQTVAGGVVGTYEYMSPEQAAGSPDIDTRTDVYSLGVLLYELLTGARPFDSKAMKKAGDQEIRRMIREDEPPRPSTRLSSLGSQAGKLTEARQMEVGSLVRQLRSELEWIPLKAMRKESSRRYESPMQLAEDIRNYLEKRPLIAGPETGSYRVRKFISKRKAPLTAAAAILIVLAGGVIGTSLGFVGQRRMRLAADALREQADHLREQADQRATEAEAARNEIARQKVLADKALEEVQLARRAEAAAQADAIGKYEAIKAQQEAEQMASSAAADKDQAIAARDKAATLRTEAVIGAVDAARKRDEAASRAYSASIVAARAAIVAGMTADAADWLHACPRDEHNWIWRDLTLNNHQPIVLRFADQSDPAYWQLQIAALAFSPDGSRLVVHGNRRVKIYDPFSFSMVADADVGGNGLLQFSRDGAWLLAGASILNLNNLGGRSDVKIDWKGVSYPTNVAFSPDGERLAGATGSSAVIWDTATGSQLAVLRDPGTASSREHGADVYFVSFTPDGKLVFTASVDGSLRLWNSDSGKMFSSLREGSGGFHPTALSPDGTSVAIGNAGNAARVRNLLGRGKPITLEGHTGPVLALAYSNDGSQIATGSKDHSARLWDARSGKQLFDLEGHKADVTYVDFSRDGSRFLSASDDGGICVWDTQSGRQILKCTDSKAPHEPLPWIPHFHPVLSPDGSLVASPNAPTSSMMPKGVHVWPLGRSDNVTTITIKGHEGPVSIAAFSPDGTRIVTGSADRTARIWDAATGKQISSHNSSGGVITAAFSCDGKWVATSSDVSKNEAVSIWEADTGRTIATCTIPPALDDSDASPELVNSIAFSPLGNRLATSSGTEVRIWDPASGTPLAKWSGGTARVNSVAYHPAGTSILAALSDGTAIMIDPSSCAKSGSIGVASTHSMLVACFSPDGTRIATLNEDGEIRIWDVGTLTELHRFSGAEYQMQSLSFSPDGSCLVGAGGSGECNLLDALAGKRLLQLGGGEVDIRTKKPILMSCPRFNCDGLRIVAAASDGTAREWIATPLPSESTKQPATQPATPPTTAPAAAR